MTGREQRALAIAAKSKITFKNNRWQVPSQSSAKKYAVNLEAKKCSCPDYTDGGYTCKHILAVEIVVKREFAEDGSVTETESVTITETKKKTYKQDWPAYNRAQSTEKHRFQYLLHDLCQTVDEPEEKQGKRGRKPHTYKDSIYAMTTKVYSMFSCRRASCDLAEAHEKGFLSRPIPGLKVNASFFGNPVFTPILTNLVSLSALPLNVVETKFAVDSSGFASSRYERWFDEKWGTTKRKCTWVKTHIICGVKTNVVTAVRILGKGSGDSPQFIPLLETTAKNFNVEEMSGDKAYGSLANFNAVDEIGGNAFMQFKLNATGRVGGAYKKMLHWFQFKQEDYEAHYHLRSNVESTFSAIKRKFGDSVRSKTDTAMVNEVLCKLLAYNITCLIHENEELCVDIGLG